MRAKGKILVVDLFCGAGGASEGLRRACEALDIEMDLLAVNHSPVAIATHRRNHPTAVHLCESIERVDPRRRAFVDPVTGREFRHRGRIDLLIAAPECTHHSTARGGRPINDQSRSTSWHILKWQQELYIDNLLIENVPEYRDWGPIGANHRPLKSRKGETYRAFLEALRSLGNTIDARVVNAADYGDPTTRRRLFIMGRRGQKPLSWPMPTHSRTGASTLFGKTKKWRAAREVIDWTIQGQSIFDRKRPLSPKTLARVFAGLERFGGPELQPFLVVLRNHMGGRSLDQPLPTLAAGGQHVGLCEPFLMPVTHGASGDGKFEVVQPFIMSAGGPTVAPRSTDEPMNTVLTRDHMAVVEPFIASYYGTQNISPVSDPLPTVTTKDRFALVAPVINGRKLDIRLRMLKPHELARAMSFGDDYQFAGNQGEQVKQIGNAWPCRLGQALIETLIQDYARDRKPKRLKGVA